MERRKGEVVTDFPHDPSVCGLGAEFCRGCRAENYGLVDNGQEYKLSDANGGPTPESSRNRTLENEPEPAPETKSKVAWPEPRAEHAYHGLARAFPRIDASCEDLPLITGLAWDALLAANEPPFLFRYGGLPSRIEEDDNGAPVIKTLTEDRTRYALSRVAQWFKIKKAGEDYIKEVPAAPPSAIIKDILATPNIPLPILTRIVEVPIFAPDGTLQDAPGYSPKTRTFYVANNGFSVPKVDNNPNSIQIEEARDLLETELLGDFPFVSHAEKAHALAAIILPFVRDLIEGPTPLHLVEKPTPGTGGTLLAEMITYPVLGRYLAAMTEGRDEDEWRKRIFAKLRGGPTAVLIDNLRRRLDSAALSSALTSYPTWEDRILGISETTRVPAVCLWLATGNNPALSNEMTRRTIRSRLDAKVDRPWEGRKFRHPDLPSWVKTNRANLVWGILTLIQNWINNGRPEGKKTIGMFEGWSKVMGGILDTAGIPGFLGNLQEFYDTADTEGESWRAFIAKWWDQFAHKEVGITELWPMATEDYFLDLGNGKERSQQTRLGKMVADNRDRVFNLGNNLRIKVESAGEFRRAKRWRLRNLESVNLCELFPHISVLQKARFHAGRPSARRTHGKRSHRFTRSHPWKSPFEFHSGIQFWSLLNENVFIPKKY